MNPDFAELVCPARDFARFRPPAFRDQFPGPPVISLETGDGDPKMNFISNHRIWLVRLALIPVMLGAIAMVHRPRWSFVPTESHPMGGMEFQVVLLLLAAWFALGGGEAK